MSSYRVATTSELLAINEESLKTNLNRAIDLEETSNIDPDGLHVLSNVYVLDDGELLRTEWLTKFVDNDEPVMLFVDIASDSRIRKIFDKLQRVEVA
jgi:hypothetical protein